MLSCALEIEFRLAHFVQALQMSRIQNRSKTKTNYPSFMNTGSIVPNNRSDVSTDKDVSQLVPKFSGLQVSFDDGHCSVLLERHSDHVALLVDRELSGEAAVGRGPLNAAEGAVGMDREDRQGVRSTEGGAVRDGVKAVVTV